MADPTAIWGAIGAVPIASAAIASDYEAVLEPVPEPVIPPEYDYPVGRGLYSDYAIRNKKLNRYIIGRR